MVLNLRTSLVLTNDCSNGVLFVKICGTLLEEVINDLILSFIFMQDIGLVMITSEDYKSNSTRFDVKQQVWNTHAFVMAHMSQ